MGVCKLNILMAYLSITAVELETRTLSTHHNNSDTIDVTIQGCRNTFDSLGADIRRHLLDHRGIGERLVFIILTSLLASREFFGPLLPHLCTRGRHSANWLMERTERA